MERIKKYYGITSHDLIKKLKEKEFTKEELKKLLKYEKNSKKRKTVLKALNKEIQKKTGEQNFSWKKIPTGIKIIIILLSIITFAEIIMQGETAEYIGILYWIILFLMISTLIGLFRMKKWGGVLSIINGGIALFMTLGSLIAALLYSNNTHILGIMVFLAIFYGFQAFIYIYPIIKNWKKLKKGF